MSLDAIVRTPSLTSYTHIVPLAGNLCNCLIIVCNVPFYKCTECNEVIYTADVVEHLEQIIKSAQKLMQEISIIDYSKVA